MAKVPFEKPHYTIDQQINILIERGLIVSDKEKAKNFLSNISYYRLSAYSKPFLKDNRSELHEFKENITFESILSHYIFDRELRLLVFDMIERLEVAFRTQISYHYSLAEPWWYTNPLHFHDDEQYIDNRVNMHREMDRSSEDFIKHYKQKYSLPKRPPSWMTCEVISMGLLSKLFRNLKMCDAKKEILKNFHVPNTYVLESWMHSLNYVRNICAHHSRLWNRKLTIKPKLLENPSENWLTTNRIDASKLFALLSCSLYLLKTVNPNTGFITKFKALLSNHNDVDVRMMGFPTNWESESLWKP